jgi:glyoxylase I family protein
VTAPPFKLLGLDHLLRHVRSMAEAERFYCEALGCTISHRLPEHGMAELSAGVTLVDVGDPSGAWALDGSTPGRNLDHFALLTDDWNVDEMREWLARHDIVIEEERIEEHEVSLYIRDPSGNLVELLKRI